MMPAGQAARERRAAEPVEHHRQAAGDGDQEDKGGQPGNDSARTGHHGPPITPVTSAATAVPAQVNKSTPIRDRSLVDSVTLTLTRMASEPSAVTLYWR